MTSKLLEVIVTSVDDAKEAEAGGADRLELVRELGAGGLTPSFDIAAAVVNAVHIPVRIMLRETATMCCEDAAELERLLVCAMRFATLPIDGLVAGFLRSGAIDKEPVKALLGAAPACHFTFHRAFDELPDPFAALCELKQFPQIDRVLTVGGKGDWQQRMACILAYQDVAQPDITILAGAGLSPKSFADLAATCEIKEIHVGRAAREPQTADAPVKRDAVLALKRILQ